MPVIVGEAVLAPRVDGAANTAGNLAARGGAKNTISVCSAFCAFFKADASSVPAAAAAAEPLQIGNRYFKRCQ
ncbi:hypothetical protein JYU34_020770 [Plutella xylostella]|uniref:Uncharacterized protein n=1 Tax=Plutella xylostella TaxID=51655 RepID=A0ABQ7PSG4_PLUXY|nr:hypothetical protein JYU34_020770 [Plutella xylostella]